MAKTVSDADPVAAFKADLDALSVTDVIRKHISTGHPFAFTCNEYYELRSMVAAQFQLHPSDVVVVGSTRIGFSLDPEQLYRPVRRRSDIDIALVSRDRFDDYWERVFQYSKLNLGWDQNKRFKNNLFNGWIDPRFLPNAPTFNVGVKWAEFFDVMMASRKYGRRTITARLYRSWDRLEAYQEPSVIACKLRSRSSG